MSVSEGFGELSVAEQLQYWEGWVVAQSIKICSSPERREDVAQEGRVALWEALQDDKPTDHALNLARARMRQYAWYPHRTPPTGSPHEGPRYEPKVSIPAFSASDVEDRDYVAAVFGLIDHLEDLEWAYHRGEIAEALASLTPKQRAYVYARFWCGMDAPPGGRRSESLRLAKEMNPQVNDRSGVLWSGNKTTTGARERLAERLEHLRELVTVQEV